MIHSIISFKQLATRNCDDKKIPVKYPVRLQNDTDVFVRTFSDSGNDKFLTSIDTKNLSNVAKNKFNINMEKHVIENGCMSVTQNKCKGQGLGVIMHLNNIISLMENNLDRIELFSLPEAVLFHGKCKFEPQILDYEVILDTIFCISQKDCKKIPELKPVVQAAGEYFDYAFETRGQQHTAERIKQANDIVQQYFDIMSTKKLTEDEKQLYGLKVGFDMVLTKEKILENKDFFNALFKKFNIDYKI